MRGIEVAVVASIVVVVGCVAAACCWWRATVFEDRTQGRAWGAPGWAWAAAGFVLGVVGVVLCLVATGTITTAHPTVFADRPPPDIPDDGQAAGAVEGRFAFGRAPQLLSSSGSSGPRSNTAVHGAPLSATADASPAERPVPDRPGWYPVSEDEQTQAYWDGMGWTSRLRWNGYMWLDASHLA